MKRVSGSVLFLVLALAVWFATAAVAEERTIDVGGVRLLVEVTGAGEPVLVMHGGLLSHESMAAYVQGLSCDHLVIAPDSRGHGRSSGAGGEINYQVMTADMLALLDALDIDKVHVIGWSDGGIVGLIMAAEHPERVRSLVAMGANISPDGLTQGVREFVAGWSADQVDAEVVAAYRANAVEPELWPVFFESMRRLWLEAPILEPAQLADIEAPTLLVLGDRDEIAPEHVRTMFDGIEGAQLFVVPGASHFAPVEKSALIVEVVRAFLDEIATAGKGQK